MLIPVVSSRIVYHFSNGLVVSGTVTPSGLLTGYTLINKFLPGTFVNGGNNCKLKFLGSATGYSVTSTFIFNPATSGNAYNSDGNQVQVLFNGGSGSIAVGAADVWSDPCAFAADPSKTILVGINVNVATKIPYITGLGSKFIAYVRAATAEAGTTLKTAGYTSQSGRCYANFEIQISP